MPADASTGPDLVPWEEASEALSRTDVWPFGGWYRKLEFAVMLALAAAELVVAYWLLLALVLYGLGRLFVCYPLHVSGVLVGACLLTLVWFALRDSLRERRSRGLEASAGQHDSALGATPGSLPAENEEEPWATWAGTG